MTTVTVQSAAQLINDYVEHLNSTPACTLPGHVVERRYEAIPGRRFVKIAQYDARADGTPTGRGRSVYCFIEQATGDVYKAEGWSKPAKGVRWQLSVEASREALYAADRFAGSHFYR